LLQKVQEYEHENPSSTFFSNSIFRYSPGLTEDENARLGILSNAANLNEGNREAAPLTSEDEKFLRQVVKRDRRAASRTAGGEADLSGAENLRFQELTSRRTFTKKQQNQLATLEAKQNAGLSLSVIERSNLAILSATRSNATSGDAFIESGQAKDAGNAADVAFRNQFPFTPDGQKRYERRRDLEIHSRPSS